MTKTKKTDYIKSIAIIITVTVILYIIFSLIGCWSASPWVIANDGVKFVTWCVN